MRIAGIILAGATALALAARKVYQRGKLTGTVNGFEAGYKHGFGKGLSRGIVITTATFAGASLQRPILEDLTPGGRSEEQERGAAARKPS